MTNKYYEKPFAVDGNKVEILELSIGGEVAYDSGYGPDYDLPMGDVSRKRIGRTGYNGVMFDATANLKQWQDHLYPEFAPTKASGYKIGQIVEVGGVYYQSNANDNETAPPSDTWSIFTGSTMITELVGTEGQNWEGVDYVDSGAVGANPTAKIYPDGTIVGSTDNGNYTKYPNGNLEVYGINKSPTIVNLFTFASPYNFIVGAGSINTCSLQATNFYYRAGGSLFNNSFSVHTENIATGVDSNSQFTFSAIGRWK